MKQPHTNEWTGAGAAHAGELRSYPTSSFDYSLPKELIASHPAAERDQSRLLVLDRADGGIRHLTFQSITELIPAGDVLVVNETRVMPARLMGRRAGGGQAEVLLLHPVEGDAVWEALVRPGARMRAGRMISVAEDLDVEVLDVLPNGNRIVRLLTDREPTDVIHEYGRIPLPPYIEREAEAMDAERYQTVYGTQEGSVAAPTAGLHFTRAVLDTLQARGVRLVRIVLHVGVGTFRPVEAEDPSEHVMHEERYEVPPEAADVINAAKASGRAVWAVGTTVTRTLEAASDGGGQVRAGAGSTALFIRPGYRFRVVDRLLTNFHLPKSTLLMLVAAFGGYDNVMRAYDEAVRERYRFYSYGDAMLLI